MKRFLILLLAACTLSAQPRPAPLQLTPTDAACRAFVQDFYNWYLKSLNKEHQLNSTEMILKYRKASFDPELLRQLKADTDASTKNKDEVVGLDFDSFLNAQDVANTYKVGNSTRKGDSYMVEVIGNWGKNNAVAKGTGKKALEPDVIPELAFRNGAWVFVNFHYPGGKNPQDKDLLAMLKYLRDERSKHHK
jgi:hypothetical protein